MQLLVGLPPLIRSLLTKPGKFCLRTSTFEQQLKSGYTTDQGKDAESSTQRWRNRGSLLICMNCKMQKTRFKKDTTSKGRSGVQFFKALPRMSYHQSALIFAAATSASRYVGPCAIHNSQPPVYCHLERTYC